MSAPMSDSMSVPMSDVMSAVCSLKSAHGFIPIDVRRDVLVAQLQRSERALDHWLADRCGQRLTELQLGAPADPLLARRVAILLTHAHAMYARVHPFVHDRRRHSLGADVAPR